MKYEYVGERLLLTLWIGSLWAVGYLAIPIAFASMDTLLAAAYAATLFKVVNILGLSSVAILLLGKIFRDRQTVTQSWRFWLLLVMAALTALFLFYLSPEMAEIKEIANWREHTSLTERFDRLHGISENIYLMLSLMGLALVLTSDKNTAGNRHGAQ